MAVYVSVAKVKDEKRKGIGGSMYKKCDEILNRLEQEGKIKRLDFHFPEKQPLKLRLKDLLDKEVDEKYYLSDTQVNRIKTSTYVTSNRRIQEKDWCDTLCARDWKDPKCVEVNRLYGIFDNDKSTHQAGSVYDTEGLSPTLCTMQGGWRQPCVQVDFVSKKYNDFINKNGYIPDMFNPYNDAEIKDIAPMQSTQCGSTTSSATILIRNKSLREILEQNNIEKDISFIDSYNRNIRKDDLSGTITTRVNDSNNTFIAIKNATKQGYLEAHDGDGCYISNIDKKRGTVQKEMIPTLKTSPDIGCVTTDLRIRKLTPKECWRLMGFDDVDFEKAEKINSNTQLYKQAGNSIVVNVLEEIFKELFSEYIPNLDKWSDLD